jgi:hypothetical protein
LSAAEAKEIKKLEQAVGRIARHADKLAATLLRLERASGANQPPGRSPATRKKPPTRKT